MIQPDKHVSHWIGGKPWTGEAKHRGDIYDPATGQITGHVDFARSAEVDSAVAAVAENSVLYSTVRKRQDGYRVTSVPPSLTIFNTGQDYQHISGGMARSTTAPTWPQAAATI